MGDIFGLIFGFSGVATLSGGEGATELSIATKWKGRWQDGSIASQFVVMCVWQHTGLAR